MTEEIKEILYCDMYNDLDDKKYEKLLNYITNLQKENTDLKKLCDKYEEEHKTTFETWKKVIARNEKAVEYIKNHTENIDRGTYYEDYVETYDLLNILEGGDE